MKSFEEMFDEYVPSTGAVGTVGGEIVRAMNFVLYRYYNDGDRFGGDNDGVNSSVYFLKRYLPKMVRIVALKRKDSYETELELLKGKVEVYLNKCENLFQLRMSEDSRNYKK